MGVTRCHPCVLSLSTLVHAVTALHPVVVSYVLRSSILLHVSLFVLQTTCQAVCYGAVATRLFTDDPLRFSSRCVPCAHTHSNCSNPPNHVSVRLRAARRGSVPRVHLQRGRVPLWRVRAALLEKDQVPRLRALAPGPRGGRGDSAGEKRKQKGRDKVDASLVCLFWFGTLAITK